METFSINTLGCKVNQYETRQIQELLERLGLHKSIPPDKPNLFVINTCCVTHTASSKSRQYIRKAQKLNPDSVIIVCGCLPTAEVSELNSISKNIHIIGDRGKLAETLNQIATDKAATSCCPQSSPNFNTIIKAENGSKIKFKKESDNHLTLQPLTSFEGQTRAFLKIQDGCDRKLKL